MSWNKVSHEQEDAHDDMLSYGDDIGTRDFSNSDSVLVGSIQIDVIRTDTGGYTDLQVLCFLNEIPRKVTGVEGSGNKDFGLQIK